jgi:thiamine-monophosphate kinase
MDEYDVINSIKRISTLPPGYSPIGDDVATLPSRKGKLVMKCDMLVGKTDVPPGMTWRMAARKAVAMCVSDFAAKGARPDSFMVSVGLPRGVREEEVDELVLGFKAGIDEWRVKLIGGDTSEAGDLIIDCVMLGFARRVVARDTAKPGELVVTTGRFGETSAGLKVLLDGAVAEAAFRRKVLRNVYFPEPRLTVGLSIARYLSSSIDSSDGLAICLHTLAEMSGVGFEVVRLPSSKAVSRFASQNDYRESDLVLYGGEEYEIVGTLPAERLRGASAAAREAGGRLIVIGKTTSDKGVIRLSNGKMVEKRGWVHLR